VRHQDRGALRLDHLYNRHYASRRRSDLIFDHRRNAEISVWPLSTCLPAEGPPRSWVRAQTRASGDTAADRYELHDGFIPNGIDRVRQAFQPVADHLRR
jgi:hypothetical protein